MVVVHRGFVRLYRYVPPVVVISLWGSFVSIGTFRGVGIYFRLQGVRNPTSITNSSGVVIFLGGLVPVFFGSKDVVLPTLGQVRKFVHTRERVDINGDVWER